jgi:hypothetical protein
MRSWGSRVGRREAGDIRVGYGKQGARIGKVGNRGPRVFRLNAGGKE